jgi:putative colanic acid biosynthesis UDP-glucose lipid carrier transferase
VQQATVCVDPDESSPTDEVASSTLASARQNISGSVLPLRRKTVQIGSVEPASRTLLRSWLNPAVVVGVLFASMAAFRQHLSAEYLILAVLALLVSRQVLSPLHIRSNFLTDATDRLTVSRRLLEWGIVVGLLLLLGTALDRDHGFSRRLMLVWFALAPIAIRFMDQFGERLLNRERSSNRYVIIGANEVGTELARRIRKNAFLGKFGGYFDFRHPDRLSEEARKHFAGNCDELADYVRGHCVSQIYIALPMSNDARIENLLQQLRQTAASIFWVPNVFAFDLIQSRCADIDGMPVISICDTPFQGMRAIQKRCMDMILGATALLLLWPLMLVIGATVKLQSSGPALFRQRRHGLNGEEIVVYKFRTMTVCEDGPNVSQAVRDDERITPIGRFLRRTSLDELPQLINVLAGSMSFVGPRPHAVAHNEQYRSLIDGYMIRHKVRPGITGWAQINGLRGETDTLDKMNRRVKYDLEYLKNWSLWLDLRILTKTVFTVLVDKNAY